MHEIDALSPGREVTEKMAALQRSDPGNGLVDVLVRPPRLWPMNGGVVQERLERGGICQCVGGRERKTFLTRPQPESVALIPLSLKLRRAAFRALWREHGLPRVAH